MTVGPKQYRYGSSVTYECDMVTLQQLKFEDGDIVKTITCEKSGNWMPDGFTCGGIYSFFKYSNFICHVSLLIVKTITTAAY